MGYHGGFDALSDIAHKILRYSTPFGHIWVVITFLLRLFPAATIAEGVYGDEYGDFECVTSQPGCSQVCYNLFAPMNHPRFWQMQILFLCFPSLFFAMIASTVESKYSLAKMRLEKGQDDSSSIYVKSGMADKDQKYVSSCKIKQKAAVDEGTADEVVWAPMLRLIYVFHLLAKFLLEVLFVYFLYYLQSFQHPRGTGFMDTWNVPFKYDCRPQLSDDPALQGNSNACGQAEVTPCWVQRPWEKKLFMMYMLFISLISIIVCFLDFNYILFKVSSKRRRIRKEKKGEMNGLLSPVAEEIKEA